MRCLILVIAILAILAQGAQAAINCTKQFYTVNTFRAQTSLSISCLGPNSSCAVYYSPPGNGCNAGSPKLIGTVAENGTQAFTFDFALGGGFCSDTQFSVYAVDEADNVVAYLPRATEAGTTFHQAFFYESDGGSYQCIVSALELPAKFTFDDNDSAESLSVDRYESYQLNFSVSAAIPRRLIKVKSDNPVIVSCIEITTPKQYDVGDLLVTLQPVSSEPLLIATGRGESVMSVLICDCSTNKLITNFSSVSVSIGSQYGRLCQSVMQEDNDGIQRFYFHTNCALLVEPIDNVCISTAVQSVQNAYLSAVGLPESKFSTRFASSPSQSLIYLYSFSETTCKAFTSTDEQEELEFPWAGGDLESKVAGIYLSSYATLAWLECENPILITAQQNLIISPFLAGYQAMELWQPFFASLCRDPPSSNAGSRVAFMFFGLHFSGSIFLLSLLV